MKKKPLPILMIPLFSLLTIAYVNSQNAPILIEIEEGEVGADFNVREENGVKYLTISTNGIAGNPENASRIVTVDVTFPTAQTYDLYIRCRVGAGSADDDSFFYGNGFGVKSPTTDGDWIRANNLHSVGYAGAGEVVDGDGIAGNSVWKWINLSEFMGDEPPVTFEVPAGNLTQTFQLGAREDGLDIDKIAFARADYFFTVSNLDNGGEGSADRNEGPTTPPIAEGSFKFLGCVYSSSQAPGLANYWNQVTPENGGKWGSAEPTRDNMVWTRLDAAYAMAKDNGFPFKLHVLVWGNQQPAWIENLPVNEQLEEIKEWFQALASRYPEIDFIDVVNEPLHDPPNTAGNGGGNYFNALGGSGTSGWDWVLEAFRLARQYFPNAQLMLNEYNIVNSATNTNRYLEIINLLREENLIDQIGVQGHAFSTRGSTTEMKNNLDRLAATGLPVYITELDIDGPSDEVQLNDYKRIFPVFWEHPAVQGITLWGFRPGLWRTQQMAYLIGQDGVTERPALEWLRSYVAGTVSISPPLSRSDHITVFPNPLNASGELSIEGIPAVKRVELFNLIGAKIWGSAPKNNLIRLPESVGSGLYILQLYDDRYVYVTKIIIQ
jgi:endo-1,4-beta-xylanase